ETLNRLHYLRVNETLLIILDEFLNLDERSYDELYLWCLVQVSRTEPQHIATLWPQVASLDLRYRNSAWQRAAGVRVYEQPYRLTDLLFYYYVLYSKKPVIGWYFDETTRRYQDLHRPEATSLGSVLRQAKAGFTDGQLELVWQALRELAA